MTMAAPELHRPEFSIGTAFEQTNRIMGRNFLSFSALYFAFFIPPALLLLFLGEENLWAYIPFLLVLAVSMAVPEMMVTRWAYADYRGISREQMRQRVPHRAVIERLIGALVLFTFAIVIGVILLILPGVVLWLLLFFIVPAIVIDNKGVWESVQESIAVAEGYRGAVYVAVFIYGVIYGVVDLTLSALAEATEIFLLFEVVWVGAAGAYGVVLALVIYEELKAARKAV